MIRVAIVTVSDSTYAGNREDTSGQALASLVRRKGWDVSFTAVLPDEAERIGDCLRELSDHARVSVILTTGGTGIAARDVTPEATAAVIERPLPGIAEFIRAEGSKSTQRAILARGVAGTRGSTLIVNLPGSPKGAVESFEAVADVIPHVVDLLEGRTEHKAN